MNARLFVEGLEVDTLGDIDVDFTYSVADISDIEKRNTSFSKTITLPSTGRNKVLFGNIFDISVQNEYYEGDPNIFSNFNPAKKAKATIFVDNVKVFDGILRLIKINNTKGDITYETNVFGRLNDILYTLGDKTIADLNFDNYNHTWNRTNIENSWAREKWVLGAQNYVYPLVDYGKSNDGGYTYPLTQFKPAVFIREILGRIFQEAGFRIIAPFFDTEYFKKQVLITTEKEPTQVVAYGLDVWSGANEVEISPSANSYSWTEPVYLPVIEQVSGWTQISSYRRWRYDLTSPQTTNLSFTGYLQTNVVTPRQADIQLSLQLKRIRGGVTSVVNSINKYVFYNGTGGGNSINVNFSLNTIISIEQNDQYFLDYFIDSRDWDTPNPDPDGEPIEHLAMDLRYFYALGNAVLVIGNFTPQTLPILEGDTMKMSYVLPKSIKQKDFLKSIITMFNLYVIQDQLQEDTLEIIPYPLFLDKYKGNAADWTYKLDYNSQISITPLSDLTNKEYRLRYDDDADYWTTFYKTKFNLGYGESRTIVDNDFQQDVKDIKIVFGAPLMRDEYQGIIMLSLYKVENEIKQPANFKPRVASWFFDDNGNIPHNWRMQHGNNSHHIYDVHPYAGHIDNIYNPTADILFDTPKEVYFNISLYPYPNLYNGFYEDLILDISDPYSRQLKAKFRLNPVDIQNLDFRRLIKIDNHYFRLIKVDKYNPINNELCEVTLFKVLKDLEFADVDYIMQQDGTSFIQQQNGRSKIYI